MPSDLLEASPDDEDYDDLLEKMEDWKDHDGHVFVWSEEYWIAEDGYVESS